MTNAIAKVP